MSARVLNEARFLSLLCSLCHIFFSMFHCSTILLRDLDFSSPKSLLDAVRAKCVGVLVNVIQPKMGKADTMTA